MNINDWNTIFLIFVLLLIAGYVYVLQERINKLEDRQDIQQKINDSLIDTCIRLIRSYLAHQQKSQDTAVRVKDMSKRQNDYNRSFAKIIRRVANLARAMKMLVNGVEINRDNLSDWSCHALHNIQGTLAHNVGQGWGDVTEEKLLMKLISVEIKRQIKVENINLAAKKKSEWIVDNWDLVERRSEPLRPLPKEEY